MLVKSVPFFNVFIQINTPTVYCYHQL